MNESHAPSYHLNDIKKAFNSANKLNMTVSAKQEQIMLGFTDQDVVDAIQNLQWNDFYKSMAPKNKGFFAWQDVYKSHFKGVDLYIKFQVGTRGELILSFKEK
ncbi:type II toxin-antitoxin system MqsR family toxin [Legionella cincinnatiensis]|uniref:Motility quorum-sensing regulator n=1 Tax=Legionella cincinnatiensis TaxID=28085 RepID=A0A378II87_9GAMM|nr:type II toxin-antitoxin system MqsR family toxin [Legionella cincinnatiensis]KTC81953.1 hypothetical protein Lcin_3023 [Legionella cincinnatiensis]STX34733.1 Uncharacterised protein [Legionella cincinnatiensis]